MSLIDDALKRAQAADAAAARPADRPWIPTPMPDPAIARRRAIARWLGILAAVAVAGAAGAWLVRRLTPATPERAALRPTPPAAAAAALLAGTPTPDAVALATPIAVLPRGAASPAAEVSPRPTRRPRPTPPPAEGASTGEPEAVAAAPTAPAAPRPSRDASGGRSYPGVAALPGGARIELGGIVWSETEPRALLNDRILGIGSYVEGWSVQSIAEDRVVLEKDGATITITVK